MTTIQTSRLVSTGAICLSSAMFNIGLTQSSITAYVAAGPTNIEVTGAGVLDIIDPYIKPIAQFTAGVHYEQALSRHWSVVTGAQYTSRGFGMREQMNVDLFGIDLPIGASLETRLNYIEVPLMLKYNFTESGVSPYVKAGASGAYALDGKITPKVDAIISWSLPEIPINLNNDIYNRFDVSGIVGAGVSIPVNTSGAFQIEGTYRHSLNDMFLDNITDIRIKSHGFSVGIGYTMRF